MIYHDIERIDPHKLASGEFEIRLETASHKVCPTPTSTQESHRGVAD